MPDSIKNKNHIFQAKFDYYMYVFYLMQFLSEISRTLKSKNIVFTFPRYIRLNTWRIKRMFSMFRIARPVNGK